MSHNKFHNSNKKRRTRISHIMPYNQSSIADKRGEKISAFFQRQLKNSHNHQSFSICHISSRDFKAFLPLISVCVPSGNSKSILWLSSSSLHLNNLFYLCKGIVHKLKLNKQTKIKHRNILKQKETTVRIFASSYFALFRFSFRATYLDADETRPYVSPNPIYAKDHTGTAVRN